MWAVPTIYYDYNLSGLVATSELTGFEVSKLLDRLESTWWKATSSANQIITHDAVLSDFKSTIYDDLAISIRDICVDPDGTLWTCDFATGKIYNISKSGSLISSFLNSVFDGAATSIQGLSVGIDGTLWVCDVTTDKIYNISRTGTWISEFATSAFDVAATSPTGIACANDGTLWICDSVSKKIYHVENDGTEIFFFPTSKFDADAILLMGIAFAPDGSLWVYDGAAFKVYNIKDDGEKIDEFPKSGLGSLVSSPQGIDCDTDGTLWMCDNTTDKIFNTKPLKKTDYLTISGHNLKTIGAILGFQYSDGSTIGSDLVTNGDFTSDAAGWTATASSLASVAAGQSGNCLEVTNSGAASGAAYQDVTGLTVGETYSVSVYFKKGTGVSEAIKIGITTDDDYYAGQMGIVHSSWQKHDFYFTAEETTARITLVNESAVSSETALFDSVVMKIVDWTDAFTAYIPLNNYTLVKEYTAHWKRFQRIRIDGTLSAAPYAAMAYWGELTELRYLTAGFDPHAEEEEANLNESESGLLLGDHIKHIKKDIPVTIGDASDALYQKVKGWKDGASLRNAIFAWNKTDYPSDIWVMRRKPGSFKAPFTKRGAYRNISFTLIGVKE